VTRKKRRLYAVIGGMTTLGIAVALVLAAFSDNLVFFYSPTDLVTKHVGDRRVRIGGLVEERSLERAASGKSVTFKVTDGANTVAVAYSGTLPDLFREGQGVVAIGAFDAGGVFRARQILAKHDERYMPRDLANALRRQGEWRGDGQTPAYGRPPAQ